MNPSTPPLLKVALCSWPHLERYLQHVDSPTLLRVAPFLQPTCSPAPVARPPLDICTPPSVPELPDGGTTLLLTVSSNNRRRTSMNWHPYNNLVVHNPSNTVVDIHEHDGDLFDLME